jgi:hypothetical protein
VRNRENERPSAFVKDSLVKLNPATVASICLRRSNPNPFYYTMKLAAATVLLSASSALAFAPSKVAFRPSSTTGLFATEVAAEPKVRVVGRLRI